MISSILRRLQYFFLPTSFIAKNRFFIEREFQTRRFWNIWGYTLKSESWAPLSKPNLLKTFSTYQWYIKILLLFILSLICWNIHPTYYVKMDYVNTVFGTIWFILDWFNYVTFIITWYMYQIFNFKFSANFLKYQVEDDILKDFKMRRVNWNYQYFNFINNKASLNQILYIFRAYYQLLDNLLSIQSFNYNYSLIPLNIKGNNLYNVKLSKKLYLNKLSFYHNFDSIYFNFHKNLLLNNTYNFSYQNLISYYNSSTFTFNNWLGLPKYGINSDFKLSLPYFFSSSTWFYNYLNFINKNIYMKLVPTNSIFYNINKKKLNWNTTDLFETNYLMLKKNNRWFCNNLSSLNLILKQNKNIFHAHTFFYHIPWYKLSKKSKKNNSLIF